MPCPAPWAPTAPSPRAEDISRAAGGLFSQIAAFPVSGSQLGLSVVCAGCPLWPELSSSTRWEGLKEPSPNTGKERGCGWGVMSWLCSICSHPSFNPKESILPVRHVTPSVQAPSLVWKFLWNAVAGAGVVPVPMAHRGTPCTVKPWAQNSSEMSPSNLSLLPKSLLEWIKVTLGCYFQPHTS